MKESEMFEMDRRLQVAQRKYEDTKKIDNTKARIIIYVEGNKNAIEKYYQYIINDSQLRTNILTSYYKNGTAQEITSFSIIKSFLHKNYILRK